MIKLENYEVVGWEHAIRGMRNPMNSWEKSDSWFRSEDCDLYNIVGDINATIPDHIQDAYIGINDHELMMKLANGGPVHAKYRRMITVYVDITAPLYWWKEFDTYKVGTVANSCSTMHKIHDKEFTREDFSIEHLIGEGIIPDHVDENPYDVMEMVIGCLNHMRRAYLEAKTKPMKEEGKRAELMKKYWWQMIQLLPSSYNQKRTVQLNYQVLKTMYFARRTHKLDEWHTLCRWMEGLPYFIDICVVQQ